MDITFTIPDPKVVRVVNAFKGLFPIPKDINDAPMYTENAWAKECVRQYIVEAVLTFERRTASENIALAVPKDDTLVS